MRQQSDLQGLAVFSKVVEMKSFSAAARAVGTTTSAVSKRIAGLEQHLGVRLLARTTRKVALTEAGTALYAHALRILADLAEAEDAVARLGGSVRGTLRVSGPVIFGERHIAPVLPKLLARHPDLRVELSLTDRYVNLAEEGLDCAVRIGSLGDSSLIAVRIGEVDAAVCASPAYLADRGTPTTPHELAAHDCLRFSLIAMSREWRFRGPEGVDFTVPVSGKLSSNNGAAIAAAVVAGAGIARLPLFLVEDSIARGDIVEILRDFKTKSSPIHVVYASSPQDSPKIRAFIDLMRGSCRVGSARDGRAAGEKEKRRSR